MKVLTYIVCILSVVIMSFQLGRDFEKQYMYVKDWYPRMNYVKFFKEERGMKDPRFFGCEIKSGLLRMYFSDGEYTGHDKEVRVDEDMISIEINK